VATPHLVFSECRIGDRATLTVRGTLDLATVNQLVDRASAVLDDSPVGLVLDLAGVDFCDSTGISGLIRIRNKAKEHDAGVEIRNPTPSVRWLLETTGLAKAFRVHDGPDGAA
jgi:anti-sigma B factor antagonist